jgi:hypothetical protein
MNARYHYGAVVMFLVKVRSCFFMSYAVWYLLYLVFHISSIPVCTLADQNVPALSLEKCTRISRNQWLTDEVGHSSQVCFIQSFQVYMDLIRAEAMAVSASLATLSCRAE